jgi:MoCo/4Fe-4S cofactor protein with predicted Tat translocation signal
VVGNVRNVTINKDLRGLYIDMGTNKKYWKGFDELNQTPEFLENAQSEFPQELSVDEFLADDSSK